MRHYLSLGILSLVLCAAGLAQETPKASPAQKHFALGRKLIQANCVDCMGGGRAGVEQGVSEIEEALKAGYPNKRAAYRLLLDAYLTLSTYTEKDPEAHKTYAEKQTAILKTLIELSPRDPEVLQSYADSLQDPEEKARILAKIVEVDPNRTDAKYELGLITAHKGKTAQGIQMVVEAIARQGDPEVLRTYELGLIALMNDVHCPMPDAERWNKELNQAYEKATQGAGDPTAVSDFKKRFLEVVEKQPCLAASKAN
jgi:hypothetical protein